MADRFDVIVVGARCAGSPLAIRLARAGLKVCVLDRARFPSETLSTHGIQPCGVKILDQLGVKDELVKVAPPIERGTVAFDELQIDIDGFTGRVGAPMMFVRRVTLDAILIDAARAAGAEVRTETAVTDLVEEDGRVVGVKTGDTELRARLVVGADGVRSAVAELVGAREYSQTPSRRIFAWAYFAGVANDEPRLWLGQKGDCGFLAGPADSGLFIAAVAPPPERRQALLDDRSATYSAELAAWPDLEAQLTRARREGPIRVMWNWQGYLRESAGPGWVLVGDAGHFKDPTAGQGIADALRQTATLAEAIENALGGATDPDRVLHDWWSWRDRDAWEMYWFSYDMGAPGHTPPVLKEMQRRIAESPRLTDGLLSVLNHDRRPSEVFRPTFALAAASKVLWTGRGQRRRALHETRALVADQLRRRRRPELLRGRD